MAFDHDDTDALYERSIRPVLVRNGVTPIIINRRESNDDLNLQIIASLDSADFCIADLTYTRPSVYFEAGYAQRAVPVVYTGRAEHLGHSQPDHLRFHFDLQMKPLLKWRAPDDSKFRAGLERRIRVTALRPWRRARDSDAAEASAREAFVSLALLRRLKAMRSEGVRAWRSAGFRKWEVYAADPHYRYADITDAAGLLVSTKAEGS